MQRKWADDGIMEAKEYSIRGVSFTSESPISRASKKPHPSLPETLCRMVFSNTPILPPFLSLPRRLGFLVLEPILPRSSLVHHENCRHDSGSGCTIVVAICGLFIGTILREQSRLCTPKVPQHPSVVSISPSSLAWSWYTESSPSRLE